MTVRRNGLRLAAIAAACAVVSPAGAAEVEPLAPGRSPIAAIQDDRLYQTPPAETADRIAQMADLGARMIRVDLRWDLVATARPADPRDPADPAYDWSRYDPIVAAARRLGVQISFTVWGTPAWAADPGVPPSPRFPALATRPLDPADFGAFGGAVARRYVPRGVRILEAGNEPNLPLFLRPQFERRGGRWIPTAPEVYSQMLSSFYAEVKRVSRRVQVCGGVTAPAGDQVPTAADSRTTPLRFFAELARPGRRPPMDLVCHHPYPLSKPRTLNFAGASYIDLYNLDRLRVAIDRSYLRGKRLWLSEFGFATEKVPEYPIFFSQPRQAEFLADAYRRVRADPRIANLTWYLFQDHDGWKSGLLRIDGSRKQAYQAFALPVAPAAQVVKVGAGTDVVGQVRSARAATMVRLERRADGTWEPVTMLRTGRDGSFRLRLSPPRTTRYRVTWVGRVPSGALVKRESPSFRIRVR